MAINSERFKLARLSANARPSSELIARKKSLAIDRYFKALETQYRNRLALLSRSNQRNKNLFMRRFAGELLGVSSELYKIIR